MSVRWLAGTRKVRLDEVKIPDFAERCEKARKGDLAVSLHHTQGPIHLPVLNAATGEVIGADRIAALHVSGAEVIECRQVNCSAAEWLLLVADENFARRQDRNEWTERRVDALRAVKDEQIEARKGDRVSPASKRNGAKSAAQREVAKEEGVTPDAIKQREKRAKRKRAEAEKPPAPPPPPVDPLKAALERLLSYNDRARTAAREAHDIATARGDQAAVSFIRRALRWITETEKATESSALFEAMREIMNRRLDGGRR